MITFLLSVLGAFILLAFWFKGKVDKMQKNLVNVLMFVAGFTLLSVTFVNGIVSKTYPFTRIVTSKAQVDNLIEVKENDSLIVKYDMFFNYKDSTFHYYKKSISELDNFKWCLENFEFVDDTASYRIETKKVRDVPNGLWVTRWSLLQTDKQTKYYYDDDSVNLAQYNNLKKFVESYEKNIAQNVSTEE